MLAAAQDRAAQLPCAGFAVAAPGWGSVPARLRACLTPPRPLAHIHHHSQLRRADKSRLRMGRSGPGRPSPLGGLGPPATSSAGAALQGGAAAAATDTDPTADLRREVEVMRALDHPNVVRLYEVIEDKEGGKVRKPARCKAGVGWII